MSTILDSFLELHMSFGFAMNLSNEDGNSLVRSMQQLIFLAFKEGPN